MNGGPLESRFEWSSYQEYIVMHSSSDDDDSDIN